MNGKLVVLAGLLAGCGATDGETGNGGNGENPKTAPIEIVAPVSRSVVERNELSDEGHLVAPAVFSLRILDADVARIEVREYEGDVLAEIDVDSDALDLTVTLTTDGHYDLQWDAYNSAGDIVGKTVLSELWVVKAQVTCPELLDIYGVDWAAGPATTGVPEPVMIRLPLAGINYRFRVDNTLRTEWLMDCQLAASMAAMAPYLHKRDIVEIIDIGVYNYRCIGGGTPPNCGANGISQHALARALDIHALVSSTGEVYSVLDDWVTDDDETHTCRTGTGDNKNEFLHDFICETLENGVWNLILTPNFDPSHADHFHVDLTAGVNGIRSAGSRIDDGSHAH